MVTRITRRTGGGTRFALTQLVMPRIRVPLSARVRNEKGTDYLCFAEGYARDDGRFQVRIAFAVADESAVHRTPLYGEIYDDEDGVTAWAHGLTEDDLERALGQALALAAARSRDQAIPRHRC